VASGLCGFTKVTSIQFVFSAALPAQMKAWGCFCPRVCAQARGLAITTLRKAEIHHFHYNRAWMPLCELKAGWIFPFKTDLRFA